MAAILKASELSIEWAKRMNSASIACDVRNVTKHGSNYDGRLTSAGSEPYESYPGQITLDNIEEKMELTNKKSEDVNTKLYNLKLHQKMYFEGYGITRVPGGWIYDRSSSSVFVPFNNEFQNETIKL